MSRVIALSRIASARSGDKGADANIGVWTDTAERFRFLAESLTETMVASHFARLCRGGIIRYELPNLLALNFILHDALGGGGSSSLRTDAQGKTLASGLLQLRLEVPEELIR